MNDLSIIIVTYNPGSIFLDCLKSLADGVGDLSYEVIVVDNASQDGVPQQAAQAFPQITLLVNADNRGFAGGNNQGLERAQGRFLLLLNPDVVVNPGSLAAMVAFLEANSAAGIVGPRTFNAQGDLSLTANAAYTPFGILWEYLGLDRLFLQRLDGQYRAKSKSADQPFEVAWVQACCLLIRREVYEQIRGLDEGFFLFAEDPDFCERALQAGWKTYFLPDAEIHHYESSAVSRYPERRIRNYHISPLHYFRKRKQEGAVLLLKMGFTLELLTKLGIRFAQNLRHKNMAVVPGVYWRILKEIWGY